jgi:hypothetical protein
MPERKPKHPSDSSVSRRPLPAATALVLVMLVLAAGSGATFAAGWDRVPWSEPRQSEPMKPLPAREGRQPDRSLITDIKLAARLLRRDRVNRPSAVAIACGLERRACVTASPAAHPSLELDDSRLSLPPPVA